MRFHVVSLPHTNTTLDFSACAYTDKVRKFAQMMKKAGHTVFIYGGTVNDAPCDEFISCMTERERVDALGGASYTKGISFDATLPFWLKFNANAAIGIAQRKQPKDFICLMMGTSHKPIADANKDLFSVEFGIGYHSGGVFSQFKVFESYAWMHTIYGALNGSDSNGSWLDAVIPNQFDPDLFKFKKTPGDYFLYIGRLIDRKGYKIAVDVCEKIGMPLKVAGTGEWDSKLHGEYLGEVGPAMRSSLMSNARAVFVPTCYIEPFGTVAIEAMACGTPVITSDWGAFTETVIPGVTGYRCRCTQEFCEAALAAHKLDRTVIRKHAMECFSLDAVAPKYVRYFERLMTLWGDGLNGYNGKPANKSGSGRRGPARRKRR